MAREIQCTNKTNNHSMTFGENGFTPFLLASVTGIYDSNNEVTMNDNTMSDGATYQGSTAQKRNIVLSLLADPRNDKSFIYNQDHRDDLRVLFQRGQQGELIYTEDGVSRKINYYTESITRAPKGSRLITVSLLCDNPFFRDIEDTYESMGQWIEQFEFDHEFPPAGEALETRSDSQSINIVNDSGTEGAGFTITIRAADTVTNPTIFHLEQRKEITVGTNTRPFTMQANDILTITTGRGNKHIKRTRGQITTEVNSYLSPDSEFFQLSNGENHISFGADSGESHMSVTVAYANEYEGA